MVSSGCTLFVVNNLIHGRCKNLDWLALIESLFVAGLVNDLDK